MDRASEFLKKALVDTAEENRVYWEGRDGDLLLALTRARDHRLKILREAPRTEHGQLPRFCNGYVDYYNSLAKVMEIVKEYHRSEQPLPELANQMLRAELRGEE